MASKKRKQRAASSSSKKTSTGGTFAVAAPTTTSRRNRRSPASLPSTDPAATATADHDQVHLSSSRASTAAMSEAATAKAKAAAALIASNTMHTITHHTSFIPSITPSSDLQGSIASQKMSNLANTHSSSSSSSIADPNSTHANSSSSYRPYALHHPRNLGLIPPTIAEPPPDEMMISTGLMVGEKCRNANIVPHSAGCRMKSIPRPTFRTLPVHPDFQSSSSSSLRLQQSESGTAALTCPTVMNNSHPHSGQVAMGDTGGGVSLYNTIPTFLPTAKLTTSALKRFRTQAAIKHGTTYLNHNSSGGGSSTSNTTTRNTKKRKRIGRSMAVVGSSIDRSNAVEGILLLKKLQCVMVATRMELECVGFENEILWTRPWEGSSSSSSSTTTTTNAKDVDENGQTQTNENGPTPTPIPIPTQTNGNKKKTNSSMPILSTGWDNMENKVMARGLPLRLHGNREDTFVLASFGFYSLKDSSTSSGTGTGSASSKSKRKHSRDDAVDDGHNVGRDNDEHDVDADMQEEKGDQHQQQHQQQQRPDFHSPILEINVANGEITNVVPLEPSIHKTYPTNGDATDTDEHDLSSSSSSSWKQCKLGSRAMAIYDKLHDGNIVGVFITYTSTSSIMPRPSPSPQSIAQTNQLVGNGKGGNNNNNNNNNKSKSSASTSTQTPEFIPQQELMVLNSKYQVLYRTAVPTKFSGSKLLTVEAINQSPHGDYTISATAKGGVLVYKTDGLQLLGAYGEGVSLHGHSIVWQDVFFIRIDKEGDLDGMKRGDNDESFSANKELADVGANEDINEWKQREGGEQKRYGQIMERADELLHRERYKEKRNQLIKKHDSLSHLFIVSVPSAFREPADMKEHIQFWDVSSLEFDGGNKLPSFELLAPKKSEGICTLLYDHSMMTSNAGKFIMSTHAGDCLELTHTLVTDWAGQMYPTGFLVLDNNLTYIEDEDELDTVIDSHVDIGGFCQPVGVDALNSSSTQRQQSEAELELALQMSMMDERIDVVGHDSNGDWSESILNSAPCRPEPHLRVKSRREVKDDQGTNGIQGNTPPNSMFDLLKQFPQFGDVQKAKKHEEEEAESRISRIEETKRKILEGPIKIPRRKQGNIEYLINASVDKHLTVRMIEKMGPANGDGSSLRYYDYLTKCDQVMTDDMACAADEKGEVIQNQAPNDGDSGPDGNTTSSSKSDKARRDYCPACQGRFVIHTDACGIRARPIDYDAIAKAEQEKKDQAEAEKKKQLQDRRKLSEQRRKEKKLKLKEEEERLQRAKDEEEKQQNELVREVTDCTVDLTTTTTDAFKAHDLPGGIKGDFDGSSSYQQQSRTLSYPMQNSTHPTHDYRSPNHNHSSQHLEQSISYFQGHSNSSSPPHESNQISNGMYQEHDGTTKKTSPRHKEESPSFRSMNFGDSIFSNIPSLPSEPTSYYGNGGSRA